MKRVLIVLTCVIAGGSGGYRAGLWWLDRTVRSPELESAVYPAIGTIVGALLGLALGLFLVLTWSVRRGE